MSALARSLRVGLLLAASSAACRPVVPVPPAGPHVDDEAIVVPYPPPAAVPEIIRPHNLGKDAVWLDGEWQWDGSTWVWQAGRWEVPHPGTYFARAQGVRRRDGALLWFQGSWHPLAGGQ